jgi:hypothetical protein
MFSARKIFLTNGQKPELRITVQPVDKVSVNGNATLSVSAATMGGRITYRWYRYPAAGMGPPELVLEEVK